MKDHTSNVVEVDSALTKLKHYRLGGGSDDPIDHDIRIAARGLELGLNLLQGEETLDGVHKRLPALRAEVEELFHIEDRARECIIALGMERDVEHVAIVDVEAPDGYLEDRLVIANNNARYWKKRFENSFCQRLKRALTGRGSLI